MADFCRECSIEHFGKDFKELADLSTPEDTAAEKYCHVLCEGCGGVWVDHTGFAVHRDNDLRRVPHATANFHARSKALNRKCNIPAVARLSRIVH